jgi:hypothetical protein
MSEPKNHHYVPQCLIKQFKNKSDKYSLYDKNISNFYSTLSSKSTFSEIGLNTILDDNGEENYSYIEKQLNDNFENDFTNNYKKVKNLVNEFEQQPIEKFESVEFINALYYLIKLGLIGNFRNPNNLKNTDEAINGMFNKIYSISSEELKNEIDNLREEREKTKYNSHSDFVDLANGIIENMGEHVLSIYIAPENEYFILPDCQSYYNRKVLQDDVIHNGMVLNSMCNVICSLGYPIDSKTFIKIQSKKISKIKRNSIMRINSDLVFQINLQLFNSAYKNILCEDESFLKSFIEKINTNCIKTQTVSN